MKMDIHFYAKTDVGRIRSANEDYFLSDKVSANEFIFIVADGMGGHQAGDVASKLAADSFCDFYKSSRKKNLPVLESMEMAIRKANAAVFEKAAADIKKRGMGTTFSAMIVADMKASIAHVGDSRIYLIRRNKLKKLTTDHSFVEKLVEEGRISPEEARDHPQKNVLYMSLGARENLTPEIIDPLPLEDGDALVMCSDGLSNMVSDAELTEIVMEHYPEEAANALVKLANANGGADNITLQIVRIGTLEMLEKTKPIPVARSRRKLFGAMALVILLTLVAVMWFVFKGAAPAESEMAADADTVFIHSAREQNGLDRISEIDPEPLEESGLSAGDGRFMIDRKLHFVGKNLLLVYDLKDRSSQKTALASEDQVVPAVGGETYLLSRSPFLAIDFRLRRLGEPKPLLIIQADKQFDLKDMESKRGKIFKIAHLDTSVFADFIDDAIFIFHDLKKYYGIRNWKTADSQQFAIPGLDHSAQTVVSFKKIDGRMTMLHCDMAHGRVTVFRLHPLDKTDEFQLAPMAPPLLVEYGRDHSLLFYYRDHCLGVRRGEKESRRPYSYAGRPLAAVKVLLDMESGHKLLISDSQRLFFMACDS
jgi:protein phosphatase